MSTTTYQDNKFGLDFLEHIVEWISENMKPEEVFDDTDLRRWAESNDFVDAGDVEPYHCKERDLEEWAKDNGYVKED